MLLAINTKNKGIYCIWITLWLLVLTLTGYGYINYIGNKLVYIFFSLVFHVFLYTGFSTRSTFFDAFISIFLWLGFWLKLTIKISLYARSFPEPIGLFNGSPTSFDNGLLVAITGISGLLASRLIRANFFVYKKEPNNINPILIDLYTKKKPLIILLFTATILFISYTNAAYSIYQKGTITQADTPIILQGIYKWLLLFGLSSFSATLLNIELRSKNNISTLAIFISLLETCLTNISLLSRGMILNSSSLLYGIMVSYNIERKNQNIQLIIRSALFFIVLFTTSLQAVNIIRQNQFNDNKTNINSMISSTNYVTQQMFTDRWIGIEGVLAVSSHPDLGWKLWSKAINEKYNENNISFYDKNIIKDSPYLKTDTSKHHFVTLPGIVAFLYYPGSLSFLFIAMFFIGTIAYIFEYITYTLTSKNLIITSLISQVIAYRLSNFGYAPSQTYMIFGAILLNITIIYALQKKSQDLQAKKRQTI